MDKKKKIILIISIISIAIIALAGATVAFFGWRAEEESTIAVTVIGGEGSCSLKEDNQLLLEPTTTKNNGRIIKFTGKQQLAETAPITWTMVINEIGGLQHETFKYEFINSTTGVSYGSGNFSNITSGSTITFSNTEKLEFNEEYEFTLYLWVDGLIGNNPLSMADQTLDFDINCTINGTNSDTNYPTEPTPLSDFDYFLGSEYSTVEFIEGAADAYNSSTQSIEENAADLRLAPISLEENEVLLVKYNGESKDVVVPNTYIVDGTSYNVIILSYAYYQEFFDDSNYGWVADETGVFIFNNNIESVFFGDDVHFISSQYNYEGEDPDVSEFNYNYLTENSTELLFLECTNLINVPVIPDSVTDMSYTFYYCTNLAGTVRINSSNVISTLEMFADTSKSITVEVPAGSTTYTTISSSSLPSNVTLKTFEAS